MGRPGLDPACDRARGLAALAPDGVLSALESRLLEAHVAGCPSCARFTRGVDAVATLLRSAEPVEPPHVVLPAAHRFGGGRLRGIAATAAVALTAVGIAARAPLPTDEQSSLLRTPPASTSERLELQSLRLVRAAALAAHDAAALEPLLPTGRFDPRPI